MLTHRPPLDQTSGGSSGGTSGGSSVTSRPASTGSLVTSVFTTSSAGSVQVITTVSTALPGSTGTSDSSSDANPTVLDGNDGLSSGAKAGIGVGAAIGGLLLLGGLGFAIFKMGRRSADHGKKESAEDGAAAGKPGEDDNSKDGDEAAAAAAAQKLADAEEGGGVAELQAPDKVHEAPDYRTRLEAPGRNEFVSELDATGGSFVIPPTSRPTTSATGEPRGSADKAAGEARGSEEEAAKKDGDAPSATEGAERASTTSGPPQSVRYETPDDIGRQADK